MAKDTEKLIRQLSLISYLMAERRPVTALEIRRDVEGYSGMNEDAFARRFYADRAELERLGIQLTSTSRRRRRRAGELLAAPRELPPAGDRVHRRGAGEPADRARRCSTASSPTPSRCGSRSSRSPGAARRRSARPSSARSRWASPASAGGHELSQRLAKIETAIFRNKTITFEYYTMERDEVGARKVDPYHLLFQGGQFYLLGHTPRARRAARLPPRADPRQGRLRDEGRARLPPPRRLRPARLRRARRLAVRRRRRAPPRSGSPSASPGRSSATSAASARSAARRAARTSCSSPSTRRRGCWSRGCCASASTRGSWRREPLAERARRARRAARAAARRAAASLGRARRAARPARRRPSTARRLVGAARDRDPPGALRAPGDARVDPDRGRPRRASACSPREVCERLQISEQELREDVNVLNVVNFGGGSYVLYAEVDERRRDRGRPRALLRQLRPPRAAAARRGQGAGRRDRPDRRPPARGLADLGAREDRRRARRRPDGAGPAGRRAPPATTRTIARVVSEAIERRRLLRLEYYKPNEDEFSERTVEPYALINGREGWYVASYDPATDDVRHFRLDRIKRGRGRSTRRSSRAPRSTRPPTSRAGRAPARSRPRAIARVWISPERARWAREERTVVAGARRRRGRRRAALRRRGLARARGAQGGRRRRRARARGRPRGGPRGRAAPAQRRPTAPRTDH